MSNAETWTSLFNVEKMSTFCSAKLNDKEYIVAFTQKKKKKEYIVAWGM